MDPQYSTLVQTLLGELSGASTAWYDVILTYARSLFFLLVGFQLLWNCITFALGKRQGDEFISMLFLLVINVGFFYSLMLHPNWILDIINSFRAVGREAASIERLSPDAVVDTGLRLASSIVKTVSITGLLDFAVAVLVSAFVALAILASFAFIAARMVLVLAEIFFAVNISPLLLAFAGLNATKYIATQYIGYVISAGLQLVVMYLLIGAGLDIATNWANLIIEQGSEDVNAFMLVGLTSTLYAVLVWNLPKLIGGLASGAPQMSSGGIASAAAGLAGGLNVGRAFARAGVNAGESVANTARAASANYTARRVATGGGLGGSASRTTATATGAVLASGVNSLLGRYGHRSASERIWTSTAKLAANRSSSSSDNQSENSAPSQNSSAQTSTTERKRA